ncbi:MAG: MBL fold metallo-hydrolase [Coriobacteriales bacterium]|jgi:glyoxylase-like metal-dependent hydrolase (beta-lactamase superfamily II)|nr:MBL fold metallo-hydrolase [Coriobacteriales bacterium]
MFLEVITTPIKKFNNGYTMNCYVVGDDSANSALGIVDPGDGAAAILKIVGTRDVSCIILTHRHIDHTAALVELRELWEAGTVPVYVHELDKDGVLSELRKWNEAELASVLEGKLVTLADGARLSIGELELAVLHTPGHSAGSMCLYAENEQVLFSGDTIFYGTTGRTDLESGSPAQMQASLHKLAELPDETTIYPGHDLPTSIALERKRALVEY